jgi:hypothetical protein
MQPPLRRRLANSPIARGAAFPLRVLIAARHDAHVIGQSVDWLVRDRETTNFTYDLHALNHDQLCWYVAAVSGAKIGHVRAWVQELEDDRELFDHVTTRLSSNPRRGICATEPRWARRAGWYALIRATQPDHVVETGTQLGLGSCAIAAALLRNGRGRLTTVDIDPEAGHLIGGRWADVIDQHTGSSTDLLAKLADVDMFIHDSLHTYDYETEELAAVEPNLLPDALVLSDNARESAALSDWAERTGRHFLFFGEEPAGHWWRGDGIGAAWSDRTEDHGADGAA